MKKTLLALAAAAAVGTAGLAPSPASAHAWWVAPAIIAGAAGGVILGATAAAAQPVYVAPAGTVTVQPRARTSSCYMARERVPGGWRRVRVCD
jgi:hypothetical protein